MISRHNSEESFDSCNSSPSIPSLHEQRSVTSSKSRRSTEDQHVLVVRNLKGKGRVILLRDLFYVFNLNARADGDKADNIDNVVDIHFMLSKDAACRAKSALDESWLFDKFIKVDWASVPQIHQMQNLGAGKPPLAVGFRRKDDQAKRRQRQSANGPPPNSYGGGNFDSSGDIDDIQVIVLTNILRLGLIRYQISCCFLLGI
ncbi:unnamed protein product [Meloidogyne enterolobii]|uniref:Uncharacterized protein n=1 Tax=Meloidogyne enterolobii TaxID=390850 RepID=A0ACB0ZYY9_MELEN